jgi:hypothetical protein
MASTEAAIKAKATLRAKLGRPAWLRGIGVGLHDGSPCIQVNVAELSEEVRAAIPEEVEGVPVRVVAVGDISAGTAG